MKGNENKPRIGIFGRRNYGKSSLINYLTGQNIAIVSDVAGATTDPVRKTMELHGVGPVVWIDTAGIDDTGELGTLRVEKTYAELQQVDLAIILLAENRIGEPEERLVQACKKRNLNYMMLYAQSDRVPPEEGFLTKVEARVGKKPLVFNVMDPDFREELLALIRDTLPESAFRQRSLLGDVISEGDTVVMVTPIDSAAPEGRMILPQVQVLRDILDNNARAVVCRETEFESSLAALKAMPRLVVTDSQVFHLVRDVLDRVMPECYLTSFSVVLARAKGLFDDYVKGTPSIDNLRDGDRVLMLESCTHNVTCEDIGRVKLPKLLKNYTGKDLRCEAIGGMTPIPANITDYALVIQCGGCVLSRQQLASRLQPALDAGVPVSNYGLSIAFMNGIFNRSMQIFKDDVNQ